jgi:PAS domain S-box-containing protein
LGNNDALATVDTLVLKTAKKSVQFSRAKNNMLTGNYNKELPIAVRLVLGLIVFCIAWPLRWALLPVEAGVAFLTFYPAMMVSYFLFGVGAGALTTILGAVIGYYVFTPPYWTFEHNQQGVLVTFIYLISSALVGFIAWKLKQHRDRLSLAIESEKLSHARYEALYVATPAMLHSIDPQGKILITSDAWLRTLGYARDEVVGRHITDFLTQESKERALQVNIPKFFATGTATDLPYQMVTKDGRVLDVLLSAVTDSVAPYEIRRSMAAIVNITEQKKAESQLAQSEAQYRFLVEGQSELISLSSPTGTLAFVNQSYALHYGYDIQDLLGRSLYDLVPETQRKSVEDHLLQVQATLTCGRNINQVCSATGELSWISWTNNPMLSADGSFLGIHSVGRDITLQIHAQTALRQSQTELQLLMDNIPGLVSNLDVNLRYRFVNRAYQEWFGVEPASLIGVSLAEFYGEQVFSGIESYFRCAAALPRRPHSAA